MDMKQIATQVIQNIGGKENIVRATLRDSPSSYIKG